MSTDATSSPSNAPARCLVTVTLPETPPRQCELPQGHSGDHRFGPKPLDPRTQIPLGVEVYIPKTPPKEPGKHAADCPAVLGSDQCTCGASLEIARIKAEYERAKSESGDRKAVPMCGAGHPESSNIQCVLPAGHAGQHESALSGARHHWSSLAAGTAVDSGFHDGPRLPELPKDPADPFFKPASAVCGATHPWRPLVCSLSSGHYGAHQDTLISLDTWETPVRVEVGPKEKVPINAGIPGHPAGEIIAPMSAVPVHAYEPLPESGERQAVVVEAVVEVALHAASLGKPDPSKNYAISGGVGNPLPEWAQSPTLYRCPACNAYQANDRLRKLDSTTVVDCSWCQQGTAVGSFERHAEATASVELPAGSHSGWPLVGSNVTSAASAAASDFALNPASTVPKHLSVISFAQAILHGDNEHQGWLMESARAWVKGEPLPPVRPSSKLLLNEMRAWLDTQNINGSTIGEIRRRLFMPFDSEWNGIVRDETAAREKPTPELPDDQSMLERRVKQLDSLSAAGIPEIVQVYSRRAREAARICIVAFAHGENKHNEGFVREAHRTIMLELFGIDIEHLQKPREFNQRPDIACALSGAPEATAEEIQRFDEKTAPRANPNSLSELLAEVSRLRARLEENDRIRDEQTRKIASLRTDCASFKELARDNRAETDALRRKLGVGCDHTPLEAKQRAEQMHGLLDWIRRNPAVDGKVRDCSRAALDGELVLAELSELPEFPHIEPPEAPEHASVEGITGGVFNVLSLVESGRCPKCMGQLVPTVDGTTEDGTTCSRPHCEFSIKHEEFEAAMIECIPLFKKDLEAWEAWRDAFRDWKASEQASHHEEEPPPGPEDFGGSHPADDVQF